MLGRFRVREKVLNQNVHPIGGRENARQETGFVVDQPVSTASLE